MNNNKKELSPGQRAELLTALQEKKT